MNGRRTSNFSNKNLHNKALPLAHNEFQTQKLEKYTFYDFPAQKQDACKTIPSQKQGKTQNIR